VSFALDPETGEPGERRVFANVEGPGAPDGSAIDAEGYLWNAQWGGSKVVRYTPAGEIDTVLELPVAQPTCLCFGGAKLDLLFVSTAREGLDAAALRRQPQAGDVLVYRTGYLGLLERRYAGEGSEFPLSTTARTWRSRRQLISSVSNSKCIRRCCEHFYVATLPIFPIGFRAFTGVNVPEPDVRVISSEV
jgi:hypothetical protein